MSETILLVEDDPSLRRLANRILQKLAYTVIAAESAEAAIAHCRTHQEHIDLLVTDVFMPDIPGPDLAARLQTLRPGLKVLYVSGSNEARADDTLLTEGRNFLQKPFSAEQFSQKIRQILDRD